MTLFENGAVFSFQSDEDCRDFFSKEDLDFLEPVFDRSWLSYEQPESCVDPHFRYIYTTTYRKGYSVVRNGEDWMIEFTINCEADWSRCGISFEISDNVTEIRVLKAKGEGYSHVNEEYFVKVPIS
jgi:hypothetical protein